MGPPGNRRGDLLQRSLNDRLRAPVRAEDFGMQLLAEVALRSRVAAGVPLFLPDLEAEVVRRPPHLVELFLRLDDDFVEALRNAPAFLLLGERAEVALAPPVASRAANPGVEHLATV